MKIQNDITNTNIYIYHDGYKWLQVFTIICGCHKKQGSCDSGKCFANYMKFYIGYFFSKRHQKNKKQWGKV